MSKDAKKIHLYLLHFFFDKHNLYVFTFTICTVLFTIWLTGTAQGAVRARDVKIACFDRGASFDRHPATEKAVADFLTERSRLQEQFNRQAPNLSQEELRRLSETLGQEAADKERELLAPIWAEIEKALDAVIAEGGYAVIVDKDIVIMGAPDITEEVVKKFTAAKSDLTAIP
jgi:outer membrane protein